MEADFRFDAVVKYSKKDKKRKCGFELDGEMGSETNSMDMSTEMKDNTSRIHLHRRRDFHLHHHRRLSVDEDYNSRSRHHHHRQCHRVSYLGGETTRRWRRRMWSPRSVGLLLFLVAVMSPGHSDALNLDECMSALGMHSFEIADEAITASSSYDKASVGPHNGRIRQEIEGGAWCPRRQIKENVYEYLQIDLSRLSVITKVETQGRFGNGQGKEFVTEYLLE
ncbi:discoidin domain-containing receptor A, partial [Aplysia californica]|uniref:Discoidin domain-containing receptor A n=1 Tax=Aplysia californica TaxID=6500 RepID=A0ABM1AEM4_APLCA